MNEFSGDCQKLFYDSFILFALFYVHIWAHNSFILFIQFFVDYFWKSHQSKMIWGIWMSFKHGILISCFMFGVIEVSDWVDWFFTRFFCCHCIEWLSSLIFILCLWWIFCSNPMFRSCFLLISLVKSLYLYHIQTLDSE